MIKSVTPKTLPKVWIKLTAYVAELLDERGGAAPAAFCKDLDAMLNSILEQDGFGTEGQNDPRGDHRG